MIELNGSTLAGFIKERQAKQVRRLQAGGINPKLVIIQTKDSAVIDTYVRMKKKYGADIGVEVDIKKIPQAELIDTIKSANDDESVHGFIVQLPLEDTSETDESLQLVDGSKDVDGLGLKPEYDPATATAILWLLSGYNIDLAGKKIAVIGQGRLVGEPLSRMLENSNKEVVKIDEFTEKPAEKVSECQIVVTATGVPRLVKTDWICDGAVVIDAGTADEKGVVVGDVDDVVRDRKDLKALTPLKGGVGPLTVCALFENTLIAASKKLKTT